MKRVVLFAALALLPVLAPAQEGGASKAGEKKEAADNSLGMWRWANFVILGGLLGYALGKFMPPYLRDRTVDIQKGIAEAQRLKSDAERRAADIEFKLKTLGAEVDRLRQQSQSEMQREGERIRQETAAQMQKLEQQAELEIESAGKTARRELKEYAASLALDLAEQRIRARLDANTAGELVDGFANDLARREARN